MFWNVLTTNMVGKFALVKKNSKKVTRSENNFRVELYQNKIKKVKLYLKNFRCINQRDLSHTEYIHLCMLTYTRVF